MATQTGLRLRPYPCRDFAMHPTSSPAAGGLNNKLQLAVPVSVHHPLAFPASTSSSLSSHRVTTVSSSATSSSIQPLDGKHSGKPPGGLPLPHPRPPAPTLVLGSVVPIRKRHREALEPAAAAAASAMRGSPSKFVDAFRGNLRSASLLPDGALPGLVRNLVMDRAAGQPLAIAELHMLMDVLVAERDALNTDTACQALQGLLEGLGAPAVRAGHLEALVDRLVCMGFGEPGRCIQGELRTLSTALVQGENRLERLERLVDLVMDNGTGLRRDRLGEAMAGVVQGLRRVSANADRLDADLHQRMLGRILRPTADRSTIHVRLALLALWENLASADQMTPTLRKQVDDHLSALESTAGPRLMCSAGAVLEHAMPRQVAAAQVPHRQESSSLQQAMQARQDWTDQVDHQRQQLDDAGQILASKGQHTSKIEDLVPPHHQPALVEALVQNVTRLGAAGSSA